MNLHFPKRGIRNCLLAAAMSALLLGCAGSVDELGLQSVETDKKMGKEVAQAIVAGLGETNDPALKDFLSKVGLRVASQIPDSRFDYQFFILDQPEPNALATPGGYVFVSRGLLALVNSEEELAGVLAHEIVHVRRRHTAKQLARSRLPSLLQLPGAVVGGIIGGPVGEIIRSPFEIAGAAYMAAHSRDDELEADQLGIRLASQSGYDPAALAVILARIGAEEKLTSKKSNRPSFFDTHPKTPKRVGELEQLARRISWRPKTGVAVSERDFLGRLDGLLLGSNPAEGVLLKEKFLHPDLNIRLVFPQDWATINTRRAVGSMAPKRDGMIVMGPPRRDTTPEKSAQVFQKKFRKVYRVRPSETKALRINGRESYLVSYWDRSGSEPVLLQFIWVSDSGLIYPFVEIAKERHVEKMRETIMSFRSLEPADRELIRETRLKIVAAREGENLEQLGQRSGNVWDLKTTAVANGMPSDQRLKEGQLVKIAISRPYKSEAN